jgi:hypothetical protein
MTPPKKSKKSRGSSSENTTVSDSKAEKVAPDEEILGNSVQLADSPIEVSAATHDLEMEKNSTSLPINFLSLEEGTRGASDIVTYNALLQEIASSSHPDEAQRALNVLATMKRNRVNPNGGTWRLIDQCSDIPQDDTDAGSRNKKESDEMKKEEKLSLYSESGISNSGQSIGSVSNWKMDQDWSQLPPAFRSSLLAMLAKKQGFVQASQSNFSTKNTPSISDIPPEVPVADSMEYSSLHKDLTSVDDSSVLAKLSASDLLPRPALALDTLQYSSRDGKKQLVKDGEFLVSKASSLVGPESIDNREVAPSVDSMKKTERKAEPKSILRNATIPPPPANDFQEGREMVKKQLNSIKAAKSDDELNTPTGIVRKKVRFSGMNTTRIIRRRRSISATEGGADPLTPPKRISKPVALASGRFASGLRDDQPTPPRRSKGSLTRSEDRPSDSYAGSFSSSSKSDLFRLPFMEETSPQPRVVESRRNGVLSAPGKREGDDAPRVPSRGRSEERFVSEGDDMPRPPPRRAGGGDTTPASPRRKPPREFEFDQDLQSMLSKSQSFEKSRRGVPITASKRHSWRSIDLSEKVLEKP